MQFKYKGYTIQLERDEEAEAPNNMEDDLFLVTSSNRYFCPESPEWARPVDILNSIERRAEVEEKYHILPLYAYIHSGVALSVSRVGQFADPWDSGQIGYVLVSRSVYGTDAIEQAESYVEEWNQYLSGDIWGYRIIDDDGDELESCWDFYGHDFCLISAKEVIDYLAAKDAEQEPAGDIPMKH